MTSLQDLIDELARDPLHHIVLLKLLTAYPRQVSFRRISGPNGAATLVSLDISASAYDRQTYPKAAIAVFVSSDHPELTAALLDAVPRDVGVVFKLSREADLAPVRSRFEVERRTAFVSFTSTGVFEPAPGVHTTSAPGDAAFRLFETQGHAQAWSSIDARRRDHALCPNRSSDRGRNGPAGRSKKMLP